MPQQQNKEDEQKQREASPAGPLSRYGLIELHEAIDARGTLCVADPVNDGIPFDIKRVFWIYGVPGGQTRGEHAHHTCAEVLVALKGSFTAHVADAEGSADFVMDRPTQGLYIPALTWCSFTDFSPDCICLCLASHPYEPAGYINDREDFDSLAQKLRP